MAQHSVSVIVEPALGSQSLPARTEGPSAREFDARPRLSLATHPKTAAADREGDPPAFLRDGGPDALKALLREMVREATAESQLRWISASAGPNLRLVPVGDVLYFQSDTKYTRVVTADVELLIRTPLKDLARGLDAQVFWPIHRSTIVNAHAISVVTRETRGRATVRLKGRADKLPVSPSCAWRFRQM